MGEIIVDNTGACKPLPNNSIYKLGSSIILPFYQSNPFYHPKPDIIYEYINYKYHQYDLFCFNTKIQPYLNKINPTLYPVYRTIQLHKNTHVYFDIYNGTDAVELDEDVLDELTQTCNSLYSFLPGYCLLINSNTQITRNGVPIDKAWVNTILPYINIEKYETVYADGSIYIKIDEQDPWVELYDTLHVYVTNILYQLYQKCVLLLNPVIHREIIERWNLIPFETNLYSSPSPILSSINSSINYASPSNDNINDENEDIRDNEDTNNNEDNITIQLNVIDDVRLYTSNWNFIKINKYRLLNSIINNKSHVLLYDIPYNYSVYHYISISFNDHNINYEFGYGYIKFVPSSYQELSYIINLVNDANIDSLGVVFFVCKIESNINFDVMLNWINQYPDIGYTNYKLGGLTYASFLAPQNYNYSNILERLHNMELVNIL